MGGLAAAGALSDFFGRVIVLDRDRLPWEGVPRSGVPQGAHTHGLLIGGLRSLQMLFPGIDEDFRAAGAVTIDAGRDVRWDTRFSTRFRRARWASRSAVCRGLRSNSACVSGSGGSPMSNGATTIPLKPVYAICTCRVICSLLSQ